MSLEVQSCTRNDSLVLKMLYFDELYTFQRIKIFAMSTDPFCCQQNPQQIRHVSCRGVGRRKALIKCIANGIEIGKLKELQ